MWKGRRTFLLFGGRLGERGGELVLPVPPGGTLPWKFEPEFIIVVAVLAG